MRGVKRRGRESEEDRGERKGEREGDGENRKGKQRIRGRRDQKRSEKMRCETGSERMGGGGLGERRRKKENKS